MAKTGREGFSALRGRGGGRQRSPWPRQAAARSARPAPCSWAVRPAPFPGLVALATQGSPSRRHLGNRARLGRPGCGHGMACARAPPPAGCCACCAQFQRDAAVPMPRRQGTPKISKACGAGQAGAVAPARSQLPTRIQLAPLTATGTACHAGHAHSRCCGCPSARGRPRGVSWRTPAGAPAPIS